MIGLPHYLTLSAILFLLAVAGIFINRRNVILLLMCKLVDKLQNFLLMEMNYGR